MLSPSKGLQALAGVCLTLLAIQPATRAQTAAATDVETAKVADAVYVITGAGCNITVSVGQDGVLLIDTGLPRNVDKVMAAVARASPQPVRIVLNTNWHYDHADGNERIAQTGALIMAHRNSRCHMLVEQRAPELSAKLVIPPYRGAFLPVVAFGERQEIHFNGDAIRAEHIPNAHSDGDLLYYFPKANVVHAGDLFFPKAIPFINFTGGSSLEGMIRGGPDPRDFECGYEDHSRSRSSVRTARSRRVPRPVGRDKEPAGAVYRRRVIGGGSGCFRPAVGSLQRARVLFRNAKSDEVRLSGPQTTEEVVGILV